MNPGFSTGVPEIDRMLRGILPGDNVVWRVDRVVDYAQFLTPYCRYGLASDRPVVYFRFAAHPPLVAQGTRGVQVVSLNPSSGFEPFLDAVHDAIEATPKGGYYVFDILSELAAAWYSDQMLCNFFLLTCPYLYDRSDLAYFALLRDRHSNEAVFPIRETCQVMIDVYRRDSEVYLRPIKTQFRHSPTMHLLHQWQEDALIPITSSHRVASVLRPTPPSAVGCAVPPLDDWNRTFLLARDIISGPPERSQTEQAAIVKERLLRMIISRDERVLELARRFFTLEDLLDVGRRTIGTGQIGGKAVGMLLAHAILRDQLPAWRDLLELHDSFYIGADLFNTYLVQNGCWWLRRRRKVGEDYLESAEFIRRRILTGTFPRDAEEEMARLLDYFGTSPIIVRSSSVLEDSFGYSFAGKYESVFCANQGAFQKRLEDFKSAIRTVYASALSPQALAYRKRYGLLDREEQMALLVQRVSGSQRGDLFFPDLAGVGFSYNPYVWHRDIDPRAGLLRLVVGLGTRAVDRRDDDYTRIVALNEPLLRPEKGGRLYTQRGVDVLDLDANQLISMDYEALTDRLPASCRESLRRFEGRDAAAEREARQRGLPTPLPHISMDAVLRDETFTRNMRDALGVLESIYGCPVDTEFTVNFNEDGTFRVNFVQCRPFQVRRETPVIPDTGEKPARVIMAGSGPVIGTSRLLQVDWVIFVHPAKYGLLPLSDRHRMARVIGRIAHHPALEGKTVLLAGPGRWGTSSPELGVPVTFSEIDRVAVTCEIVAMREGLIPEVSLGTHFFSELVEADMLYLVLYPDHQDTVLDTAWLESLPNRLGELCPEGSFFSEVLLVCGLDDLDQELALLRADTLSQETRFYLVSKASEKPSRGGGLR